jgi:hypothetical protein
MAEPMGERMKSLEVNLGHIVKRLDAHDDATAALSIKLDTIINNQSVNANSFKTKLESITTDIEAMKPHTDTVADFKKFTTFGKLTIGVGVAAISTLAAMKGWIAFNWNWLFGK